MVVSPENSWRMGRMDICENTATKIIIPQQGGGSKKKKLFLSLTGFWFQILMDQVVVNFFRSKILSMGWKNSFSFFLSIIRSQFCCCPSTVPTSKDFTSLRTVLVTSNIVLKTRFNRQNRHQQILGGN